MLPSFRFLFAAIVLSMSILVFGLGAAAMLRTAHEEFASNPFWHRAPETTFPQQGEPTTVHDRVGVSRGRDEPADTGVTDQRGSGLAKPGFEPRAKAQRLRA